MSHKMNLDGDHDSDRKRRVLELDAELDKYSFARTQQIFDDSPGKSELNQFGDFSGSHSEFDPSLSIERGMGEPAKDEDFSFRSKSAMPPMSTLSSLSSRSDLPRKARSEGGQRPGSVHRFSSPMSTRKVTALGMHESESEYSPSKYYQPARTPHGASRLQPQSMRKVSPRQFKDTATLFQDLGLDDSVAPGNMTTMAAGQSFRLPKNLPDLTALLASSRKARHKVIESVPVSEDNQKLFIALKDLQLTIDALEQQNIAGQDQIATLQLDLKRVEDKLASEDKRANFAENELKKQLSASLKSGGNEIQMRALDARNETLLNALNTAKKDLENRSLELDLAREESANVDEERNRAITRLAHAHEKIDSLTKENEALAKQVKILMAENAALKGHRNTTSEPLFLDDRISEKVRQQRKASPASAEVVKEVQATGAPEDYYSDEGIEVSKSILHESEVEDLTQQVKETRAKNARRAKRLTKDHSSHPGKGQTKQSASRSASAEKAQSPESTKAPPRAKTATRVASAPKSQRQRLVLELSEDEDSFVSEEDSDLSNDEVSDNEDMELFSNAEDETAQILYRRKPVQQARGRLTGAAKVNVQKVINELSRHDAAKCTICSRKAAAISRKVSGQSYGRAAKQTSRPASEDANATIRPSQPPVPALHSVLSGLEDEFRHLKLKYHSLTDEYNNLDPSLGKRKRKTLAADLRLTIESLEGKADQIYAIFDVLEAAATGMGFDEALPEPEPTSKTPANAPRREWIHT